MVNCGNCHESHATAAEVRACYMKDGKTKAPHERPMSSKQSDFIDSLIDTLSERDHLQEEIASIVGFFYETFPEPTSGQASNFIDVLNNLRWLLPQKEEASEKVSTQEPIEFTDSEKRQAEGLCPRCGVSGDQPCKTKSGNEASVPHTGRYATAS